MPRYLVLSEIDALRIGVENQEADMTVAVEISHIGDGSHLVMMKRGMFAIAAPVKLDVEELLTLP